MTNPIPSGDKSAFDQSQFSIQKSMENEATGNLASLKVKMQDGKEVKLENALEIMTSSFEKLTPSQQNDEVYVLKDRLSYIKKNSDTNQESSSALLKTIEAYEKKFSQIEGKEITESPFQENICQITAALEIIASPQSNGDVLLNITLPNAPSRFFTLKQNEHDKTITISELGNPVYSKTIPDDATILAAVMAFKGEIVEEMTKAKEALVKKTSDNVEKLAGAALKDIEESQGTLSTKKFSLGGRIARFFKSIGSFFASIPKFFARIPSPATETTQPIDKSRVKLLAGKTKAEGQAPAKTPTTQGFDIEKNPRFVKELKDTKAVSNYLARNEFLKGSWVIRFSESTQQYVVCMKGPNKDGELISQYTLNIVSESELKNVVAKMEEDMQIIAPVTDKTFGTDQEIINSCFKGNLNLTEAKSILESKPEGTYLLRASETSPDSKVLCFFNSANLYTEILMTPKQPGGWTAEQKMPLFDLFFSPGSFDSMEAVIHSSATLKANLKQPLAKSDSEIISELSQGKKLSPLIANTITSGSKGTYCLKEGEGHKGKYEFICSAGGGLFKIIGVKPDPDVSGGWITYTMEPGKKFGSLNEVLNYPAFKEYLTTPQLPIKQATTVSTGSEFTISPFKERSALTAQAQVVTPFDAEKFQYDWQIKHSPLSEDAQKEQIGKATAEELLGMASRGLSVSAEEFLAAAEKLKSNLPSSGQEGGPQLTTLHDLYCRAADKFEATGDVTKAFEARANAASFAGPAASSKLHNMSQAVAFGQQAQKSPLLPAHFSGLDTGILKGGSLRASNRTINGNEITQLDFKLSRFARQDLQEHLLNIQNNLAAFEASLPAELKGKVRINEVKDTFLGKKPDGSFAVEDGYTPYEATAIQIEFGGVGSVIIGNNKEFGCLFNNIKVLVKAGLPEGKAEQQVHQMLTMLGVGPILNEQRPMDEERLKTALIFRNYYPQQATKMERTKEFYEMPLDMLKQKIEAEVPEMKDVFKKYEDHPELIEKKEIYPGKTTFSINDIGMLMRKKGAYGLMAGVGSYAPASDAADTVVLMMKYGALSSQDRFQAGLFVEGASSEKDLRTGGGDHVFTRLINDETAKGKLTDTYGGDFTFSGTYQMLYDLDVCNTGAYGYKSDEYGVKNPDHDDYPIYAGRKNLPDLTEIIDGYNNEIMVKNTVPPAMMRGIVCQTQENKDILVEKLTAQGVIVDGKINGKPVDSFIHVASKFKKEMWDN